VAKADVLGEGSAALQGTEHLVAELEFGDVPAYRLDRPGHVRA
jgi:hypothetical protein